MFLTLPSYRPTCDPELVSMQGDVELKKMTSSWSCLTQADGDVHLQWSSIPTRQPIVVVYVQTNEELVNWHSSLPAVLLVYVHSNAIQPGGD